MAESLAFDLKLVDSVTANAKHAADSLKKVQTNADKAQDALAKGLGKQFEKVGFAAARAAKKQQDAFAASFAKIGLAAERAKIAAHKKSERASEKAEDRALLSGVKEALGFKRLASVAFLGSALAEGAMKIGETMIEAADKVVDIITDGVKDAFKAAGHEQTLRITEKNTLGAGGAKEFREDAERFAKLTPFNDTEIREQMLALRRAGLSQAASRQALATATDIGGGDKGAVSGVLSQFQSIYTRKGVGRKQLVELLGNVGGTIPDFYKELGKKLHVSAKTAETKAEQGGLDPQMIVNMITQAQNKRQGGIAGTGGLEYAKSFEARWKKITELPEEFYKKFVDSPSFSRANAALGQFLEQISPDSPAGQRIMASLDKMFGRIGDLLSNPDELIDGLVSGIENAIGLFEQLLPDVKNIGFAIAAAADEMSQLITGARVYAAILSGDKQEAARLMTEQAAAKVERMATRFREQNERSERERAQGTAAARFAMGDMYGAFAAAPQARGAGGKQIHVTVAPGAVTVHTAPGEDPTHTHQQAGQEVHRHVVNAIERAAAESGG